MIEKGKRVFLMLIAVFLTALACSCAAGPEPEIDSRIVASAFNSYAFKTYLKDDDIRIRSEKGMVTLTGTVSNETDKALAQTTVAGLPGVRGVDNRLEVKGVSAEEGTDEEIGRRVEAELLIHPGTKTVEVDVHVRNGIVTLRGDAENLAQKELVTEYVKGVRGVRGVVNELAVTNPEESGQQSLGEIVDDASITARVKLALLSHRSTSALSTKIDTRNGVVTVFGKARNEAEKELVTKLITGITGVRGVNNRMTVEGS